MPTAPAFIPYPDPRFQQAATARPVDETLRAIGSDVLQAASASQAYGLAAHHIGHVAPVVIVSISSPGTRDYRVLFNPRVSSETGPLISGSEGSVSLPGVEVEIARAESVEIGYDDENGHAQTLSLSGFAARVAQHEIDQVNGVFFLTKLSRLKRDAALRKYRKGNR